MVICSGRRQPTITHNRDGVKTYSARLSTTTMRCSAPSCPRRALAVAIPPTPPPSIRIVSPLIIPLLRPLWPMISLRLPPGLRSASTTRWLLALVESHTQNEWKSGYTNSSTRYFVGTIKGTWPIGPLKQAGYHETLTLWREQFAEAALASTPVHNVCASVTLVAFRSEVSLPRCHDVLLFTSRHVSPPV